MEKQTVAQKDKSVSLEIIRFLITGTACALVDFLICYLVGALISFINIDWLETAIYTLCGFTGGVICNYLLSTFWVFKNVENKNKTKTKSFIILFVLLSAVGWLISFITMYLCTIACQGWFEIDINSFSISQIFTLSNWVSLTFWAFVLSFGIKTLLGMVWNYLTRKFILYKAPKDEITNE